MKAPRPHQTLAIDRLRDALRQRHRRVVLEMPTGAGKTITAACVIQMVLDKQKRVTFTVPAIELIDQTVRALWDMGIRDVGVIQANHHMTDPTKPVQVASLQTLEKRTLPETDLVIVDEAHRMSAVIKRWMEERPELPFIGMSATPWKKGLGRLYDKLIKVTSISALQEAAILSPFRVLAPSHPDLSTVRTKATTNGIDYVEDDLEEAMTPLVADVVETWLTKGENRPTLCFAVNRAHAKHLQERFDAAGVPTGYVDANTNREDRDRLRAGFANGSIKVVCNVGVLTTGVDWDVRCIILARPTKSEMLYVQIIGRGLRVAEGKADCLILDHSDTTLRLGFVTDIHHDRLDDGTMSEVAGGKERDKEPLPRECPKCTTLRPPRVQCCPGCGFKPEQQGKPVETIDGELIELDVRGIAKANRDAGWDEKIAFMRQLRAYGLERGYARGWAANQYKTKFGVWPNDPRVSDVSPAAGVSPEVRNWIKGQAIRYAKAREAGQRRAVG